MNSMTWLNLFFVILVLVLLLLIILKRRLFVPGANLHDEETIEADWHDTGSNPSFSRLPHNVHHTLTPDLTESLVLSPDKDSDEVALGQTGADWHKEINPFMETGQINLDHKPSKSKPPPTDTQSLNNETLNDLHKYGKDYHGD